MFVNVSVGGGSAGSAVAARLAEDYRVLLLEAGGDPHPLSYVPVANPVLLGQPIIDWEYFTEPLNNSGFAFIDQVSYKCYVQNEVFGDRLLRIYCRSI